MKLGISGRLGPVRVGLSTRGGGVGFRPIKATYDWVRGTDVDGAGLSMVSMAVRMIMLSFFLVWPFGLTTLAMRHFGFEDASAWSKAAAWTAESIWLLILVSILFVITFGVPTVRRRDTPNHPN